MERVLITGAAGGIGRGCAPTWRASIPCCACPTASRRHRPGRARRSSLPTSPTLPPARRMCAGIDGIVHLGGQAIEADWETVLQANIVGCYNLFEAARRQGVQAGRVRQHQPRHRLLSRAPPGSTTRCRRAPTAATASARRSARRSGASTPTSSAWACCASASAISPTGRSTGGGCRSGSARATSASWCGSGWSIPTCTTRSSTAPPRATAPGGTMPTPIGSATGREDESEPFAAEILAAETERDRPGRRAVPGRPVLLGRVRRRPRPDRLTTFSRAGAIGR